MWNLVAAKNIFITYETIVSQYEWMAFAEKVYTESERDLQECFSKVLKL